MRVLAALLLMMAVPAGAQTLDCSDRSALPQIALNQCAAQDFQAWDDYLNAVYQQVIASGAVQNVEALREAQRAWIPYRDLTCDFEADRAFGGSIAPLLRLTCLTRLTERRANDIATYLPN
jgi:uncharacterized protein YecT (DUF1311 family)